MTDRAGGIDPSVAHHACHRTRGPVSLDPRVDGTLPDRFTAIHFSERTVEDS
jgi:hypothetical protein